MNLIPMEVGAGVARIAETGARTSLTPPVAEGDVLLGIRPERLSLTRPDEPGAVTAYVASAENLGGETVIGFRFHDILDDTVVASEDPGGTHHARVSGAPPISVGDRIGLAIPADGLCWFDTETGLVLKQSSVVEA
ncbi:MAG: TOBE domain-containing protein [Bifidobacteriaceae bacterium]|nr:TOBE domain-containing protein [Bifidobacteriaceae bacterium]